MKFDALKKHGDKWVTIRPSLQVYNDAGVLLHHVEDAWWLHEVTDKTAKLRSRETQHQCTIGLDFIHSYYTDPEGAKKHGTSGMLQMNAQLLLFEGQLLVEPTAPPGTPLKTFVVSRSRETLYTTAAKLFDETRLVKLQAEYAMSPAGIEAVEREIAGLGDAFKQIAEDLAARGTPIRYETKWWGKHTFILHALGWWVTFTWQWSGRGLDGSMLTVAKYNGHPPWPGVMLSNARSVTTEQYSFGLVSPNEARWISRQNSARTLTTADVLARVLTELIQRPNANPATVFDLGG